MPLLTPSPRRPRPGSLPEAPLPRYQRLVDWLAPVRSSPVAPPPDIPLHLFQAREQIMTVIMRVAALVGLVSLLFAAAPVVRLGLYGLLSGYALVLALAWLLALARGIDYRLRGGALVAGVYLLAVNELLHFGYSVDAHIYLVAFSLFPAIFFGWRAGVGALLVGVATLGLAGWQIAGTGAAPFGEPMRELTASIVVSACINFVMVTGAVQAGMYALLYSHELAWRRESQARSLLKAEHDLLDQRVAERTGELALARDRALAASRADAAQKAFLAALHQTTLDLLSRHALDDVLQLIVDRSTAVLDAPYGELMLIENDELVVRAYTANQSFLQNDRVRRDEALLSWQALDSREPAVIADYSAWAGHRALYAPVPLQAVADFPILVEERCVGVLGMGRDVPGHVFTPDDIQKGTLFAQLAALLVENARLYDITVRDLHERTRAERLLQEQNAELDAFARTVAHDLRSPLTTILGYSEILTEMRNRLPPEEVDTALRSISRVGRKMVAIIDELLLLARVRSSEAIPSDALSMSTVIAEVMARLQPLIVGSSASIDCPDSWPRALGYAPWVEAVWTNYLSNAIKYGGTPPVITLGADCVAPGVVRFWVRDNGPGLTPAEQARLFTPFTRLHADRADGQGLGLAIVQRIIEKQGGDVGVESMPGAGATFFFTLPAALPD